MKLEYISKSVNGTKSKHLCDLIVTNYSHNQSMYALLTEIDEQCNHKNASHFIGSILDKNFTDSTPIKSPGLWLENEVKKLNKEIRSNKNFQNNRTTLSSLIITENKMHFINIGESRIYLYDNKLNLLNIDHNLSTRIKLKNQLFPNHYTDHKDLKMIKDYIGSNNKKKYHHKKKTLKNNDLILLSTDGLHNFISYDFLEKSIEEEKDLTKLANILINKALQNKSDNNLSLILVRIKI